VVLPLSLFLSLSSALLVGLLVILPIRCGWMSGLIFAFFVGEIFAIGVLIANKPFLLSSIASVLFAVLPISLNRFLKTPLSNALSRSCRFLHVSANTIGYTASRGRFCHCFTSSMTALVTFEIKVGGFMIKRRSHF